LVSAKEHWYRKLKEYDISEVRRIFFIVLIRQGLCRSLIFLTVNACGVYSFKDVSYTARVKSIHIGFIETGRAMWIRAESAAD